MSPPRALGLAALALGLAGCGSTTAAVKAPAVPASIHLTSPAFTAGGLLPARFTCLRKGVSPPLVWTTPPAAARALALVVDDPDAAGGDFTHWVLVMPAGTGALPEGGTAHSLQANSLQARNSAGGSGYAPPCPPPGDAAHRYIFTLYALRAPAAFKRGADPIAARRAIVSSALATGRLVARFAR